jgi:hypothetical protein
MIKAAGFARGTSRTIARLRGAPRTTAIGPVAIDALEAGDTRQTNRRRRRRA